MRVFIILFVVNFISNGVLSKPDCKAKLQQCENKKPTPRRQVCGTDNQTYPNRCALLRVQCAENMLLEVKHRGKCKEKQPCWLDQGKKTSNSRGGSKDAKANANNFTPECSADGTYAPIQCHKAFGYCWCVTANGRMIPGTTVFNKKPECPKRGKKASKNGSDDSNAKKGCDPIDRSIFVKNLVRIFKTEYNRDAFGKHYTMPENETGLSLDARAVNWKFVKLDKDRNSTLTRNEYKDLRKLVKKVVRPRRCSRAFIRLCDVDQNTVITKPEWTSCLSLDNSYNANNKNNNNQEPVRTTTEDQSNVEFEADVEEEEPEETPNIPSDPASVLEESVLPLSEHGVSDDEEDPDKVQDCVSERQAAMEEFKLGNNGFMPECSPNGLYKKIQCFASTDYCWCVSEETGRTIPGTTAKNKQPNCDNVQIPLTPMKGCPDEQRIPFVKDLLEFFRQNMSNSNLDDTVSSKENQKSNDYAASLGFYGLDANKNKVLERKEWKVFRSMVFTNKNLRRCGRKLPRYCDRNHDQKIDINEWLKCLNIDAPANLATQTVSPSAPPRRRGPNPETILKDDD